MNEQGNILRQAREGLGMSLTEMSQRTRIHRKYLYALEENQLHLLPSPLYARSLTKVYAKSLGLPAEPRKQSTLPVVAGRNEQSRLPQVLTPGTDLCTFAPRSMVIRAKRRGREEGKTNSKMAFTLVAILGLALFGTSVYFFWFQPNMLSQNEVDAQGSASQSAPRTQPKNVPVLEEGEMSSNPKLGQLYEISGVKKIHVTIKAKSGETTLFFGESPDTPEPQESIRVGQTRELENVAGKSYIWFRLGAPSNTEILVNGQPINTTAQDMEKSYFIKIKK